MDHWNVPQTQHHEHCRDDADNARQNHPTMILSECDCSGQPDCYPLEDEKAKTDSHDSANNQCQECHDLADVCADRPNGPDNQKDEANPTHERISVSLAVQIAKVSAPVEHSVDR